MVKKTLCVLLTVLFLMSAFCFPVAAEVTGVPASSTDGGNVQPLSDGLLITCSSMLIRHGISSVHISATTYADSSASKVGFKKITLQRLINNQWLEMRSWTDQYTTDSSSYIFDIIVPVAPDYTYRVVSEHYAEKKVLLLFTSSDTFTTTSGTAYVPYNP